jgi:hypothetical protein
MVGIFLLEVGFVPGESAVLRVGSLVLSDESLVLGDIAITNAVVRRR